MSNVRSIDQLFPDDVFDMGGVCVLNFSDRTFAQFFADELTGDVEDPVYARNGGSKAKRQPASDRALAPQWYNDSREPTRSSRQEGRG